MHTAMIMAAGRGERFKEFTRFKPKPLFAIAGMPLIERHVINLQKSGCKRIVINHAYLGYMIKHHLGDGSKFNVEIIYCAEPPGAFETYGGIIQALPYLGSEGFLVVNGDIFSELDFNQIKPYEDSLIHIVLVPKPTYRNQADFDLLPNGRVTNARVYTLSGCYYINPQVFNGRKLKRESMANLMRDLATRSDKITGEIYNGAWYDIGSLEAIDYFQKQTLAANTNKMYAC
jgi:N-acetyl-alpha-D-muramate 1-phosphate uridylyltransferase